MAQSDDLIREEVKATVEHIGSINTEELRKNHPDDELQPLDVRAEVDGRGNLSGSITLVLTTGGPHIELDVTRRRVTGWWGSAEYSATIVKSNGEEVCDILDDYYREYFEGCVLA